MTEAQMDAFLDESYADLEKKQNALNKLYPLGDYEEVVWNDEDSTLKFLMPGKPGLAFKVAMIGSYDSQASDWLWGWADESLSQFSRDMAKPIQKLSDQTGFAVFQEPSFEANEDMAWELTAMAVRSLNAIGIYHSTEENETVFLALLEKI